jgi:hypothetical protein
MYFNQEQKPTCSAIIVIDGKIKLPHCLHVSGPYIDTEARKIDSLPYAIIEKFNCCSHPFFKFVPLSFLCQASVKTKL